MTTASQIIKKEEGLRGGTDRMNFEALWQRIADLMIPAHSSFREEVAPGTERTRRILDSTAPRSLEQFASFLLNSLSNPATMWFKQQVLDDDGNVEMKPSVILQQYAEAEERTIARELGRPGVGFYTSLHTCLFTTGAFGTDVMYVDMVKGKLLFEYIPLCDVVIDEDIWGMPDTAIRTKKTTARKGAKRWRKYFSSEYDLSRKEEEEVVLLHYVAETTEEVLEMVGPQATKFDYVSVWVDKKKGKVIATGGFDDMPYIVSRWYKGNEDTPYGRSPGMTVLPDVRLVNSMSETILRAGEKQADMPILLKEGALLSPVRSFAGGITFTNGDVEPRPLLPAGSSNVGIADQLLKDRQGSIRDGFFVPLFATPESPVKTATQVLQEADERNRAVAPMLVRQHHERYAKIMPRVVRLLKKAGKLPKPPDGYKGTETEFLSPIVASQRQVDALGVQRLLEGLGLVAQFDPNAVDVVDADRAAEVLHAGSGAPSKVLTTKPERDKRRKQRAEQQQAVEGQESALAAAEVGAKLTAASN